MEQDDRQRVMDEIKQLFEKGESEEKEEFLEKLKELVGSFIK